MPFLSKLNQSPAFKITILTSRFDILFCKAKILIDLDIQFYYFRYIHIDL